MGTSGAYRAAAVTFATVLTMALAGCSGSGTDATSGRFSVPTPTPPEADQAPSPWDCIDRGGTTEQQMSCMGPYAESMLGQAYAPVVEHRGISWSPPAVKYGDASTACGEIRQPTYCPVDRTVVLPLERISALGEAGAHQLLAIRPDWDLYPTLQRFAGISNQRLLANNAMSMPVAIAHEYAHNVQALVGALDPPSDRTSARPDHAAKGASGLELDADCLAGWALRVSTVGSVRRKDKFTALALLVSVGDDYGAVATGQPSRHASQFSHGAIAERVILFTTGYRMAARDVDPWPGCERAVEEALTARDLRESVQ